MSTTIYTPGQIVMVCESPLMHPDQWFVGIVTRPTDPEYGWTGADVRISPNSVGSMAPGWANEQIRLATDDDLANLPDWQRSWLDKLLLDRSNPPVPRSTRLIAKALKEAGIDRLSDLQRFSDADLLALKGIGQKAVAELRKWQRNREATANG